MKAETNKTTHLMTDPEVWVDEYGDYLYRYALARVRDPKIAEDVVQETFLAALHARDSFSGRSAPKTWFVGILKHKIIDQFRKNSREQPVSDFATDNDESMDELFNKTGHWKKGPAVWNADPRELYEKNEFWEAFQQCLNNLPPRIADAFSLRELEGMETKEICEILEITQSNLWVMLHRARMQLRRCLEINWFGEEDKN